MALNNLGLIYVTRGDFDRALDYFERALKLSKASDEPKLAAYASNNLGPYTPSAATRSRRFAISKKRLTSPCRNKDKRLEAGVLTSLADAYFLINSPNHSLKLLKEAAATFATIEEPGHESEALISLADGYTALRRYQEALDVLRPVLKSRRMRETRAGKVMSSEDGVHLQLSWAIMIKAIKHYEEALSKLEAAGDDIGKVDLYAAWGAASSLPSGTTKRRRSYYTKGLSLAQAAGIRQNQMFFLARARLFARKQGNWRRPNAYTIRESPLASRCDHLRV